MEQVSHGGFIFLCLTSYTSSQQQYTSFLSISREDISPPFKIINEIYGNAFCSYFLGNRSYNPIPHIRTDNVTFLLLSLQKAKEEEDGSIIPHTRNIYWDIRCK